MPGCPIGRVFSRTPLPRASEPSYHLAGEFTYKTSSPFLMFKQKHIVNMMILFLIIIKHIVMPVCRYINRISYGEDWKGFYQCDPRSFNQTATQEQLNLVLGGTMCMWGEWVDNSNILSRTFPRGAAPAERLWSAKEINNVNFMRPRLNDHRCRMAARGYPAEPSMKKGYCKHEYKHKQRY